MKIIIESLICSFPDTHRYLELKLSDKDFILSKGVVNIFIQELFSTLHILIIEFGPSSALKIISPLHAKMKFEIDFECPEKIFWDFERGSYFIKFEPEQ